MLATLIETREYTVYGVSLESEIRLALPEGPGFGFAKIDLRQGSRQEFARATDGVELRGSCDSYQYALLPDASSYVRWIGLGEFLVSANGRRILCHRAAEASSESFQVYLLGQALSFALVKQGFEPLHGTAIVDQDEAIVLLGDSGFGKSTLAAKFVEAGHTLLTDDLVLLRPGECGLDAYPGPPRIKLFPDSACRFLGSSTLCEPMNADTHKQIVALEPAQHCTRPVRLRAIYALAPPGEMRQARRVSIEPLPPREAFVTLIANTFNGVILDPGRLERQIAETTRCLQAAPVRKLFYPRSLDGLSEVRDAILADSRVAVEVLA